MQDERELMISAQARLISRMHDVVKSASARAERAEENYERVKLAGQFYMMLQTVITENPILQSEWNRFLSFVKLADAQERLAAPPRWSAPTPPPDTTKITLSEDERDLLIKIGHELPPEVFEGGATTSNRRAICQAITRRTPITFYYKSQADRKASLRLVEPYTLGEFKNGNHVLVGREISKNGKLVSSSDSEPGGLRTFTEDKIENIKALLTETFRSKPEAADRTKWKHITASV